MTKIPLTSLSFLMNAKAKMKSRIPNLFAFWILTLSFLFFGSSLMAQQSVSTADNDAGVITKVTPPINTGTQAICTTWVGTVGPANTPVGLRAFRDGALSTCAAPGPCTPSALTGALHYVQHSWTNNLNAVQCVTVTYTNTATNFSFVTAHNGSVVLTNFCTNWLGDPGSSAAAGQTITWSFNAPPLATIVFHVGNVTAGQTANYSISLDAVCAPATGPTVTINQAVAQPDPTTISPINFTAVFSQPVTGFATGDVVLSGTAGATTGVVTGSGTTYNVAVSGMTTSGTVIATIPAGVAINATNEPNQPSTSTDNTVTFISACPNIVIVADPGTTICEGDPTLLTVRVGSSSPVGTLYNQTGVAGNGAPSQVFEPANAGFTSQAADDFVVPAGTTWTVTRITTLGIGTGNPTSVNVFFYANSASNLPGAAIASFNNIAFTRTGANYDVTLPSSVVLAAGTYWMSFQVNMSFATSGQWFWGTYGAANIGFERAWQNPGGGFATPCTSWGYGGTGCNVGGGAALRNHRFTIVGSSLADGGPLPPGFTFLWSPAAGLSSTTSNPVAASPMNTTTYNVIMTGPGCTQSASILITVNKRPTVTVHPVSRVNCGNSSATFSVTATGTGLTYQWQQSVTGCAGPWTNLSDGGPISGATTATLTINPVTTAMNGYGYRVIVSGICAPINNANISNCATLTVNPLPNVTITPPVSCGGVACMFGTQLSVASAPPPVPGSVTANSGAINLPVPDNTANGINHTLAIAGVPANATILNISVALNMPHTYPADMVFNLRGPNGQILSLYKHNTNTDNGPASIPTAGFYNAIVNATSTIQFVAVPTPYRYGQTPPPGPFRPDALNGVTNPGYTIMDPTGFVSNAANFAALYTTPVTTNGNWTLAMCDGGPADLGTLQSWSITIDYTTPGGGGGPVLTYTWSPLAGLYTDAQACIPYTGGNTPIVYAAPTVLTVYTVTATNTTTGCVNTATAIVNYTPPPPTVTPSSVTMCLGDPAVKLKSSSSSSATGVFNSGTVNVVIPDGPTIPPVPASYPASVSNITVSGIPAGANITNVRARFNITHAYVGDLVMALKAPNGSIYNLDAMLNRTNNPGANFTNTVISSAGTILLSAGTAPWTGTFRPDGVGATFTAFGFTFPGGPVGYVPTTPTFSTLYSVPNGVWSIGIYDAGAPDAGVLNNWSLEIDYTVGVPATPAVWSPAGGLFSDAAALTPYVAGTEVDSVWTRPTPAGVYNYDVTVRNIIGAPSTITTPMAGGNGNNLVAFNVRNNNPYPVTFNSISSNAFGSGAVVSRVFYKAAPIAGAPGPISAANGWTQFGTANNTVVANTLNLLMTGLTLSIPAGATYGIALDFTGATFPAYTNGGAIVTYSNAGVDLITGGNVGWGGPAAPGTPVNNPRNFNGSITLLGVGPGNCTSPPRRVVVTVNQPTTLSPALPIDDTTCTNEVATFTTAVAAGTGPHTYRWEVSTDNGNNWTGPIVNGGVYSGATTATLTITSPPFSMNGYLYRAIVTGAAPCGAVRSRIAKLTVNPLPQVSITANRTALFPGSTATITSTVGPAAARTYTWLRNGVVVPNQSGSTLVVTVDQLGTYRLRVTDVNGCIGESGDLVIRDSATAKCFIYPNPTSGTFQVRYYSDVNNVLPRMLTVYDSKGDRVFTQMYPINSPYTRMDVDMRAYGKGIYWVEIGDINKNRLSMCRVVIQ